MKNTHPLRVAAASAALLVAAATGFAQIERLTLEQMVAKTDGAVFAEITGRHVFRVDHPVDGPELYFTTLTLEGERVSDGTAISVDVTFPGGFVDDENGVHNSEAPSADDVRIGNRVVAFYAWTPNMGGDVAGNALYASHGGIYRTVESPKGTVVLGRGEGYAIEHNLALSSLSQAVKQIEKR